VIDTIDNDLRRRFAPLTDWADDSDWSEVRLPRRRLGAPLAIAAALALTIAVAAPAVGLPHRIVQVFSEAKPASAPVSRSFTSFGELTRIELAAPPRQVIAIPAASLWVAPAVGGGICTLVKLQSSEGAGGDCGPRDPGLSMEVSLHGPFSQADEVLGGPVLLRGSAGQHGADSLRLSFEDGQPALIPLVWVSAPVETGFFLYAVPREHWRPGHLPTTLTLLAADGHELAHREVHGIP
jgi:hypothetical protein